MDPEQSRWEHRLRTRLTTIKLALQLLRRNPRLCSPPDGPAARALEAVDQLSADIEELVGATRGRPGA